MFNSMAPNKKDTICAVMGRSFVSGSIICFISACIAGMWGFYNHLNEAIYYISDVVFKGLLMQEVV